MKCKCGFKFAGAGEFRNCQAFITQKGKGGIICPKCGQAYVDGQEVTLRPDDIDPEYEAAKADLQK